jgi:hypothetical protein
MVRPCGDGAVTHRCLARRLHLQQPYTHVGATQANLKVENIEISVDSITMSPRFWRHVGARGRYSLGVV